MNELSLYILDLVQNSVAAMAKRVTVDVSIRELRDEITIGILDDGKGMDAEFLERVTSPFTTTRTTRKVGLGIPMVKQLCEGCDGRFSIESAVGVGTRLTLVMRASHIDLPPLGDLPGTMVTLVTGSPEKPEFSLRYATDRGSFSFDTAQIREALGGVPLNAPEVLTWIRDYIAEGIESAGTGRDQIESEVLIP